jgi:uncharacterized protein
MENIESISKVFIEKMKNRYGEKLSKVILYGSYARGEQHEESDIDFMVILNDSKLQPEKVGIVGQLITEIKEQFNVIISILPVTIDRYMSSDRLFYKNVRREGIVIYE